MAGVKVRGMKKVQKSLSGVGEHWPAAVAWAAWDEMKVIFAASQKLVPRDTEELALSGEQSFIHSKFEDDIVIGYSAAHAVEIHENTSYDAARKERALSNPELVGKAGGGAGAIGGESKYLEKPYKAAERGMMRRIERGTEKYIRAGKKDRRGMRPIKGKKV